MNLDFAFLAAAADTAEGKFFVIGGGIDTFGVSHLPTIVPPFSIVIRFSISEQERGTKHSFGLELKKPNGISEKILENGKLPFEKHVPGRRSSTTFVVQFGMPFEIEGEYGIRVFGDDEFKQSVPFWVEVQPDLKPELMS